MSVPDSIDKKIVRLLGQNARQNSTALAKQLNLSAATVRRRLKKLLKSDSLRIIRCVDPTNFGQPIAVVITLDVSNDKLESAIELLANQSEIKWVSSITGRFDIIALARFPSTSSLSDFLTDQLAQIEGVRNSETFMCLDIRKGRFVPFT